ncbi:hypothetical protein Mnod_2030 [Methylobacterium nodulans ORS 2060]|uniref:HTH cro/C1-type domain-containing protein n=1 Tax=Methylobacterium nodulans (strain LMG 21967 / CNCM I-2342 / ORS 2060) TaxID=460265 RepID=B8ITD0_METNO|nr:hypothetical protein Mnod_2030 [Methylobacterium nodulans ORS 2060]
MTPDRFRACLALVRWSQRGLAEALECDDRLVQRWDSGEVPIPTGLAAWLENLAHSASLSAWLSVPPHRGTEHLGARPSKYLDGGALG